MFVGIGVLGIVLFLSGVSFAEEGTKPAKWNHEAKIKLLQDSAAALQQSDPVLAKGLSDYAADELKESQERKEGAGVQKEAEGKTEKQMEEGHQGHIKLLRDAATALQGSHPDLAADLNKTADKHEKKMKDEQKKDLKEAGEKKE